MLRRRPDDSFELRFVEDALQSFVPPRLAPDRKEALRLRIMSSLGEQDQKQPAFGILPRERWILVPAGIGIIATILAAARVAEPLVSSEKNQTRYAQGGLVAPGLRNDGYYVAASDSWLSFRGGIAVGVEDGASIAYHHGDDASFVRFLSGRVTVVSSHSPVRVIGPGFSVDLERNSIVSFETRQGETLVGSLFGVATLSYGGQTLSLLPGALHPVPNSEGGAAEPEPAFPLPKDQPGGPAGNDGGATSSGSAISASPGIGSVAPSASGNGPANPQGNATQTSPQPPQPAVTVNVSPPSSPNQGSHAPAPETVPVFVPGDLPVPSDPGPPPNNQPPGGSGNGNGNGTANSNAGGTANGGAANSNAGGTGNGVANSNAGGAGATNSNAGGNGAANSNTGGNANGASDSNAGGNSNSAANSNAGGNGNGAANSNAGGNGNGAANSNAGGNGNGAANSNAGGNGAANSNAGGNGNGAANSSAGGNGNGAANSNAGGNGNGAANSNAGGNGKSK